MTTNNPLVGLRDIPDFAAIDAAHVEPAMTALLAEVEAGLERLEAEVTPTWDGLMTPLERLTDNLELAWSAVGHLLSVRNTDAMRKAYELMQPEVVRVSMRIAQSPRLFAALEALRADEAVWGGLDDAQRRIVEASLKDARHAGVGLEGDERTRFNAIQTELAALGTTFSNRVLDATKAWSMTLTEQDEVAGLPPSALALAAQQARAAGAEGATAESGPWRITLDHPSFAPFMQHSRRRDLRERVYRAYVARAAEFAPDAQRTDGDDAGQHDNREIIARILALRAEKAQLLGFPHFAALSLDSKMAASVDDVDALIGELRGASRDAAFAELDALRAFAAEPTSVDPDSTLPAQTEPLMNWDTAFWAEHLREARFGLTDELLRPWFPLPKVLDGLFALAERLFDVRITAADGQAPVWHEDVRFFRVLRAGPQGDEPVAAFFLDPYSRPAEKRGGAWMNECLGRSALLAPDGQAVRLPVAYLVCNQSPPVDGEPSLMTFREVETLFHEFGHGLQHMLTRVEHGMASGIRGVEWDAVELPSQFMENWCYRREVIDTISGHVETGEPLPEALFDKILAARQFMAGSAMLRQLYFATLDLALHRRGGAAGTADAVPADFGAIVQIQRATAADYTVIPPLPEDRFLCHFGHIFAGGYAAGYYSYKWAEVLSADAFAAFEEAGLDDDDAVRRTGRRFRDTVLAEGGARHPMEVYQAFRGRAPSTDALLRHNGLSAGRAA